MRWRARHGFSLLEVLLATSILIGSAIVLLELATIGNRHASAARDLTKSQFICQSKLNELLARVTPVESVRPMPIESDPEWVYWVEVQPLKQPGLVAVEVTAAREIDRKKLSARYTLVRWVRDPKTIPVAGDYTTSGTGPGTALGNNQAGPSR